MKIHFLTLLLLLGAKSFSQQLTVITSNLKIENRPGRFKGMHVLEIGPIENQDTGKFYFKNTGDKDLLIERIESDINSCGGILFPKYPIKPGARDSIVIVHDVCCYIDTVFQWVSVYTNEKNRTADFPFVVRSVFSEPDFSYELSRHDIVDSSFREDSVYSVKITNTGNRSIVILSVRSMNEYIFSNFYTRGTPGLWPDIIPPGWTEEIKFKVDKKLMTTAWMIERNEVQIDIRPCYSKNDYSIRRETIRFRLE